MFIVSLRSANGDDPVSVTEAPKSVRNFVQLCLEGYFDDTIFHRVILGFLRLRHRWREYIRRCLCDEFHSRLRFNHRGIVAMANEFSPNTNGSPFFFTLDKCDWLDKKLTIFGKVTGDSIFNLVRLGEVDTGKDDRPLDPAPKILSVEVLWNPFEDIVPRVLAKTSHAPVDEVKEPPKKACEPRLLKPESTNKERNASGSKEVLSVREALGSKNEDAQKEKSWPESDPVGHSDDDDDDGDETKFDAKMRNQVLSRRKEMGDIPPKPTQKKVISFSISQS
ncbi:hypothetical protein Bca4012_017416 [Brassica carinata]